MTCVMPSTSMPRAAMSVATSTRTRPERKASSARWRAFCALLPWIASDGMPALLQLLGDAVGAVLGAREDDHAAEAASASIFEQVALVALVARTDFCSMRSTVIFRRDLDAHRIADSICWRASAISGGIVAEKSSDWRRAADAATIGARRG
jgi:hypothetical protein